MPRGGTRITVTVVVKTIHGGTDPPFSFDQLLVLPRLPLCPAAGGKYVEASPGDQIAGKNFGRYMVDHYLAHEPRPAFGETPMPEVPGQVDPPRRL